MFARSLALATGAAVVVSAFSEDSATQPSATNSDLNAQFSATTTALVFSSHPPNTKSRKLDVYVTTTNTTTTTTTALATAARSTATELLPTDTRVRFATIPGIPQTPESWYQYLANRTSGKQTDKVANDYMTWLLEPTANSDGDNGIVNFAFTGNDTEPNKVLPGTCEFKIGELEDSVRAASKLDADRQAEKAKAFQARKATQREARIFAEDLQKVQDDQFWLLRSYIRCCTSNIGRALLARSEDTIQANPEPASLPAYAPRSPEPAPNQNVQGDRWLLGFDRTAPCEDQKKKLNMWLQYYTKAAEEAYNWVKNQLPKYHFDIHKDEEGMKSALTRRERIVQGYKRCCPTVKAPGPVPTGENPFPSVPKEHALLA
jgi:hypothetical protein